MNFVEACAKVLGIGVDEILICRALDNGDRIVVKKNGQKVTVKYADIAMALLSETVQAPSKPIVGPFPAERKPRRRKP